MSTFVKPSDASMKDTAAQANALIARYFMRLSAIILFAPLAWFSVIGLISLLPGSRVVISDYLIWSVTSFGLILSTVVVLWAVDKKLTSTIGSIERKAEEVVSDVAKDFRGYLETAVAVRETFPKLRELLLPELRKFYNSDQDNDLSIIGVDRLRPSYSRYNVYRERADSGPLDEDERGHYEYGRMFDSILGTASPKIVRQFIYLLHPDDFADRVVDFQMSYLAWLEDQSVAMRVNRNYTLVNTPRAPIWGSPVSYLFFGGIAAQVFFAQGGLVIFSRSENPDFSATGVIRHLLLEDYIDSRSEAPARQEYNQLNLSQFEAYADMLRIKVTK